MEEENRGQVMNQVRGNDTSESKNTDHTEFGKNIQPLHLLYTVVET
jgi:hypothetical protein